MMNLHAPLWVLNGHERNRYDSRDRILMSKIPGDYVMPAKRVLMRSAVTRRRQNDDRGLD